MDLSASGAIDPSALYRRRTILLFGRIGVVTAFVFAVLNAAEGRLALALVDCVGGAAFAISGRLFRRERISPIAAAVVFASVGLGVTTAASYSLGGGPQNFVWLIVPAMAATFLGGRRVGLAFLFLGFVPMVAFSWMRATGYPFPPQPSVAFDFALLAGASAILWAFAASYDRQKDENLRALDELRRRAEDASRAKSTFLAHMSHEIRTPMNGLVAMTELLHATSLDADQAALLRVIRASNGALVRVIDDILDFSRVEAGKISLEDVDFDVRALIEGVRAMVATANPTLSVTASVDADVPAMVHGDPGRVRQVLLNLAGNAVKFTPQGKVELAVLRGLDGRLRFEVRDTGIGIPIERLSTLFAPFTQVDASTTRRYGGTGLGLAISRGLVEAMGGTISATSAPDAGSTFAFDVPLAPSAPGAKPALDATPELAPAAHQARVLVAEDNAVNQYVTRAILERQGHTCVTVANGKEAVDALVREAFDLVLMDCQMPELDGFAATRAIRALAGGRGETPIVALTASALSDEHDECLASGMNEVLTKPITYGALAEVIERLATKRA